MTIHDIDDPTAEICIPCYKGCGASTFKCTPSEFEELGPTKQADIKETWCGVPILACVLMQLDENGDKAKLFLTTSSASPSNTLSKKTLRSDVQEHSVANKHYLGRMQCMKKAT